MNICLIFNERPVLNQLRLVRTSNWSRPVLIGFLQSLIGPVWFFEVLGLWWTGLGLGLSPWRSKTETGPDFQSLVFHAFGHQWPCQVIYHPRKCKGFGFSDGEGCEQFWHSISKLIAHLRVCGVCYINWTI